MIQKLTPLADKMPEKCPELKTFNLFFRSNDVKYLGDLLFERIERSSIVEKAEALSEIRETMVAFSA